ncbi:MAG: RNA 2',3'-cyclic phosphodiesterase [Litorimonas sp.]
MILFAAVKPNQRTVRALLREQKGVSGARWSSADKLHITTAYFGQVDDDLAEQLDVELARLSMASFDVQLSGAGHFGKHEPHAIWAGVAPNPSLERLNTHCKHAASRCGLTLEKRKYMPHVTLAYMKPFPDIERIIAFEKRLADFSPPPFLVDELCLFSSHRKARGPNLYRLEATYPLLG